MIVGQASFHTYWLVDEGFVEEGLDKSASWGITHHSIIECRRGVAQVMLAQSLWRKQSIV